MEMGYSMQSKRTVLIQIKQTEAAMQWKQVYWLKYFKSFLFHISQYELLIATSIQQ